jgi:uncharacterized protein (DUF58 family)
MSVARPERRSARTSHSSSALTRDIGEFFPRDLGTKDINSHPLFTGPLSRLFWRFAMYRLTRAGRLFLPFFLLLTTFAATSLEIQSYIFFVYAGALWLVTLGFVVFSTPQVTLRARHADRVRGGATLQVEVEVRQVGKRGGFDLNLVPHRLPFKVDAVQPAGTPLGMLAPGEVKRVRVGLRCPKRGAYILRGWRVESDFPFGLMNAYRVFHQETEILVHPDYQPFTRMDLPTSRRFQPGGVALASKIGDSMEYLGNRDYREGDNIRDIDWRATARMGGMPIVREYREEYFQRIGVVLDTYIPPTLKGRARAERQEAFERAVSLSAAVGEYMAGQDYIVDLFAAGPNLYHLTAGRGLAYLEQMLDILACVEESKEEPLTTIAPEIQENLERLTTVVCLFLSWDETRQAFAEQLRRGGAGVKVVLVASGMAGEPTASDGDLTVIDREQFEAGVEML